MRLIDADKILEKMQSVFDMQNLYLPVHFQQLVVDDMPTVDAVPVVRCKDCKFFDHSDFGKGEEYWCKHFVSTYDNSHCHKVTEDDFCSLGEKR